MSRFLLALIIAWGILSGPLYAVAADNMPPELNPLCWRKDECACERAKFSGDSCDPQTLKEPTMHAGFVEGEAPCDKEGWGKCLPAGKTVTQISFGGKREFSNIGVFLQLMYRYAVGVAGIIAVVMIMVAGMQWVTSGGNSEAITSAKKRIAGAMMGLFLVYLSYFILNAVNPLLISFRLPQIFMVRKAGLVPQFCSSVSSTGKFLKAAEVADQKSKLIAPGDFSKPLLYTDKATRDKEFGCGNRFFIEGGGDQTCFGDICPPSSMCTDLEYSGKTGDYKCLNASIIGRITNDKFTDSGCLSMAAGPFAGEGWESPEIVDTAILHSDGEQELWVVCGDGQKHEVTGAISKTFTLTTYQTYYTTVSAQMLDSVAEKCPNREVKGAVIKFEMNEDCDPKDENHWVGYDGDAGASQNRMKDLGDDIFFTNNAKNMNTRYFIPLDKIKKGMILNMYASTDIYDIDCEKGEAESRCAEFRIPRYGDLLIQ